MVVGAIGLSFVIHSPGPPDRGGERPKENAERPPVVIIDTRARVNTRNMFGGVILVSLALALQQSEYGRSKEDIESIRD
jgi:hypothetical protein